MRGVAVFERSNSVPSSRIPVPQSNIRTVPSSGRTSTHEVLPPNNAVLSPGVGTEPRVPQKRTRTNPPYSVTGKMDEERNYVNGGRQECATRVYRCGKRVHRLWTNSM